VVDVVLERVLQALHPDGALGTIAAGNLDPPSVARKEHGGREVTAPCVSHPGGRQIGAEAILVDLVFVHVTTSAVHPAVSPS
jgi:hypothetical protein